MEPIIVCAPLKSKSYCEGVVWVESDAIPNFVPRGTMEPRNETNKKKKINPSFKNYILAESIQICE